MQRGASLFAFLTFLKNTTEVKADTIERKVCKERVNKYVETIH